MKIFPILSLMVVPYLLSAQENWEQVYPDYWQGLTGLSKCFDMQLLPSEGYLLAGATDYPTGAIRHSIRLLKTDFEGALIWDTTLRKGAIAYEEAHSIWPLESGGYLIGGTNFRSFYFEHLKLTGESAQTTLSLGKESSAETIRQVSGTEFIVGGWGTSNDGVSAYGYLLQVGFEGVSWQREYTFANNIRFMDIELFPSGDIIVAGQQDSKALIARLNPIGDTIWTRTFQLTAADQILDLDITPNGTLIFCGRGEELGVSLPIIGQMNSDGELDWLSSSPSINVGEASSIAFLPEDKIIITGSLTSFFGYESSGFIAQYDWNGEEEWAELLPDDARGAAVQLTEDQCILVAGNQGSDFYLMKKCSLTNSTDQSQYKKLTIDLFPKPAQEYIQIRLSETPLAKTSIRIFDLAGKPLKHALLAKQETIIPISDLRPGIFFFLVEIEGRIFNSGKLIIQR